MNDILDALKYPFTGLKNLIILSITNLAWFILLPMFVINGYLVTVIRSTLLGEDSMPKWDKVSTVIKHGIFITIIIAIYLAISPLLSSLSLYATGVSSVEMLVSQQAEVPALLTVLLTITAVIQAIILLMLPMVALVYAASEDIRMAFNLRIIFEKIMIAPFKYFRYCLYGAFIYLTFLLMVPIFTVFSGIVMVYPVIVITRLFSKSMKEIM